MASNRAPVRLPFILLPVLLNLPGGVVLAQQIPAAQRAYEQGLQLEQEGRHEQAAQKFRVAVDINPEFGDAYYWLGISQLHAGKTEGGIKALLKLTQIEPTNVKAMLAAADAYVSLDLYDDALALYSRAQQLDPKLAIIHYNLGSVWFHKKEYTDAVRELEKSVSLDPSGIAAQRLLAAAYLAAGDAGAAQKRLQEAIDRNRNSPELPADLGDLLLSQRRIPEAEQQFQSALRVRPDYAPARLGLTKLHRRSGQTALALQEVSEVLKQDPGNAAAVLEKGQCEYALGSLEAAAHDFEEFSRLEPASPEGEYLLGLLDLAATRYPSAVNHFKRAVDKDAKLADAYYYMAEAYYKNHQKDKAREALTLCLEIDGTNQHALKLREILGAKDIRGH